MSNLQGKKTVFIGGGRMGEAIFSGLIVSGAMSANDLTILDVSEDKLKYLAERYGVNTAINNPENLKNTLDNCEVVVLAITPQFADSVLKVTAPLLVKGKHTVVSILGGVELKTLESYMPGIPVIRVMPNTPAAVQAGAAGVAVGSCASDADAAIALDIFNSVGKGYLLPEDLIDPLTGISGCGPAYAYLFIEAMADGGVELGLPRDLAIKLAAQTLIGAGKMVLETGEHPGALKDNVCSPGGSTIVGVHTLEQQGFRGTVIDAVTAAVARMKKVAEEA